MNTYFTNTNTLDIVQVANDVAISNHHIYPTMASTKKGPRRKSASSSGRTRKRAKIATPAPKKRAASSGSTSRRPKSTSTHLYTLEPNMSAAATQMSTTATRPLRDRSGKINLRGNPFFRNPCDDLKLKHLWSPDCPHVLMDDWQGIDTKLLFNKTNYAAAIRLQNAMKIDMLKRLHAQAACNHDLQRFFETDKRARDLKMIDLLTKIAANGHGKQPSTAAPGRAKKFTLKSPPAAARQVVNPFKGQCCLPPPPRTPPRLTLSAASPLFRPRHHYLLLLLCSL